MLRRRVQVEPAGDLIVPAFPSKPAAALAAILLAVSLCACGDPGPRTTIVLTVSAQGDMTFEGRPIAANALLQALETRRKQGDPITLLIRAEPTTSYDKVGTAMVRANEAGIADISFKNDLPPPSAYAPSASDESAR